MKHSDLRNVLARQKMQLAATFATAAVFLTGASFVVLAALRDLHIA